jgi:hypothetical protein
LTIKICIWARGIPQDEKQCNSVCIGRARIQIDYEL